jgi:hypothetical protein
MDQHVVVGRDPPWRVRDATSFFRHNLRTCLCECVSGHNRFMASLMPLDRKTRRVIDLHDTIMGQAFADDTVECCEDTVCLMPVAAASHTVVTERSPAAPVNALNC